MISARFRASAITAHAAFIVIAAVSVLHTVAIAHGPTRQKVTETIRVDAPPEKVWSLIGNFGSAHEWLPMVVETESEGGNEAGAQRILTLDANSKIYERLKKYDREKMSYTYKIPDDTHDVGILPVNNYSSTISVKAKGTGSLVTWKGAFYRGYPNNDPPEELNDEAAVRAVTAMYKAGLTNLKSVIESQ
jgi:carbon monoxide dehydrogenase subunit G